MYCAIALYYLSGTIESTDDITDAMLVFLRMSRAPCPIDDISCEVFVEKDGMSLDSLGLRHVVSIDYI